MSVTRFAVYDKGESQVLAEKVHRSLQNRLTNSAGISCPVEFAAAAVRLAGAESCGKCTPCRIGLAQLANLYDSVLNGNAAHDTVAQIEELSEHIYRSSDCAIGYEAGALSLIAAKGFRDDFIFHVEKNDCGAGCIPPVPCRAGCPAEVDVPAYLALTAAGRHTDAVRVVRKDNPLAIICGLVCEHPCELQCRRGLVDDPINIRGVKRFAADHMQDDPTGSDYTPAIAEPTGKRVAVIGGGPAGLTCAYFLALMGHSPTIFEQREALGGMLRYGIPAYRLPHADLCREISWMLNAGIEVQTGTRIGVNEGESAEELNSNTGLAAPTAASPGASTSAATTQAVASAATTPSAPTAASPDSQPTSALSEIAGLDGVKEVSIADIRANYDATYIAIGAHAPSRLGVPGEDAQGVMSAVELLYLSGSGQFPDFSGQTVCIVGGGNVAMDAARTALRLNAAKVSIAYRRRRLDMTARSEEVEAALAEGCELIELAAPLEIEVKEGKACALKVQPQIISVIENGRAKPVPANLPAYSIACDLVIVAIGQAIDSGEFKYYGLPTKRAKLLAEANGLLPGFEGIFSGGDCVTGPATVIRAVAAGKAAAAAIDTYLGYDHRISLDVEIPPADFQTRVYCARSSMTEPHIHKIAGNFEQVERGLLPEEAMQEANRCLRCDHFGLGALREGRKASW